MDWISAAAGGTTTAACAAAAYFAIVHVCHRQWTEALLLSSPVAICAARATYDAVIP
jgi:hypothetical protein